MTSRPQMIINILQANPTEQCTARQLAQKIIDHYSSELMDKRNNPRFVRDEDFLSQIAAEIGGSRTQQAKAVCPQVMTRDKPRPRLYYRGTTAENEPPSAAPGILAEKPQSSMETLSLSERELYPKLIRYLSQEEGLFCLRIDEKRSLNNKGVGGNHWLYPDIAALQPLDTGWHQVVQNCVRHGGG